MVGEFDAELEAFVAGADDEVLRAVLLEVELMREPPSCPLRDAWDRLVYALDEGRDVNVVQALLGLVDVGGEQAEEWLFRTFSSQDRPVTRKTLKRLIRVLDDPRPLAQWDADAGGYFDLEFGDPDADLDAWLEGELRADSIHEMLGTLAEIDPKSAVVLDRVYLKGMISREAGAPLGVSRERARQLKMRGLEKARRILGPELAA